MIVKSYVVSAFNSVNYLGELSQTLASKVVATEFDGSLLKITVNDDSISPAEDTELSNAVTSHDSMPTPTFRIMDLVNTEFKGFPIESIDFKRHLRRDLALQKKTSMSANGRPVKSSYYHNDVLFAEIRFEFTDYNSLMVRRKEDLYYVKTDGSYSDPILIKDKPYDLTDPVDGAVSIEERINSRKHIVSHIKAFLSGVIMQALGQSIAEVIVTIGPFWDECWPERSSFIEFGTNDWVDYMNKPETSTEYSFLAIPVAPSVTVKDYIISKIDY